MIRAAIVVAVSLATATIARADSAYLVKDLPGYVRGHGLTEIWATIGNTTYFKATRDPGFDVNVWKTDGTKEGTVRVTNVTHASLPHAQDFIGVLDGLLLYSAYDPSGTALYGIDADGGDGVPRVITRAAVQGARSLGVRDGVLYFATEGYLWRTDGTAAGTKYFDYGPGSDPGIRWGPVAVPSGFVFFGTTANGAGLHWTAGADETSTRILGLTQSEITNVIEGLSPAGGKLVYHYNTTGRNELWASDGTAGGTTLIASPMHEFTPVGMLGGQLLFKGAGPQQDEELWITDGTAEGTRVLTDLGAASSSATLEGVGQLDSLFFFTVRAGQSNALWVTDGTPAGTRRLLAAGAGKAAGSGGFVHLGKFYFRYSDGVHGAELWESDGTTAGTRMVIDFVPGPESGGGSQGHSRRDGVLIGFADRNDGVEPYLFDPVSLTAQQLRNIGIDDPAHGSSPQDLRASEGRVFFTASLPAGPAFGRSDGTHLGTTAEFVPAFHSGSRHAAASKGLYFYGSENGLTVSDGTRAGTTVLLQQRVEAIRTTANGVVFEVREGGSDDVWASDGTLAGTKRIFESGTSITFVSTAPAAEAWFETNRHLWRTDGTTAGTVEITPASGSFDNITHVHDAGGIAYIADRSFSDALTLWRVDGTVAHAVKTIPRAANTSANAVGFASAGPYLYFVYNDALHRSDGTEAGTFALPVAQRLAGGTTASCPVLVLDLAGTAIAITNASDGATVWRTDGSAAGTMVLAKRPGVLCSSAAALGDRVYFRWTDGGPQGFEPWVTDGTVSGTHLFANIDPGVLSSSQPLDFITAGARVFFTATTPGTGRELWAIGDPAAPRRRGVRK